MSITPRVTFQPTFMEKYSLTATLYLLSTISTQMPALPYSLRKAEDVDSDAEDHIYDETRYFCMARPLTAKENKQAQRKEYDPFTQY